MANRWLPLVVLGVLAYAFWSLVSDYVPVTELPLLAAHYAAQGAQEMGAQNLVAAIIVSYRGLDTLGEVTVLFLASGTVAWLLSRSHPSAEGAGSRLEPAGELLNTGVRMLLPLLLLLGAYVFVHGHLTPGGGFQGGAIMASGLLLLMLAGPMRRFGHGLLAWVESLSGLSYVGLGLLGLVLGGGFLDTRLLPLGDWGHVFSAGAIPLIYSLIGLKVGAEFASILTQLEETEAP